MNKDLTINLKDSKVHMPWVQPLMLNTDKDKQKT
jgi:hypothetical protein